MVSDPSELPRDACAFWSGDVNADDALTIGDGDTDSKRYEDHRLSDDADALECTGL